MSNIRNMNAGNPFWDFLASMNNAGADHPFFAAFDPEARNRGPPPGYDAPPPPPPPSGGPAPPNPPEDPPSPPPPSNGPHGHPHHGPAPNDPFEGHGPGFPFGGPRGRHGGPYQYPGHPGHHGHHGHHGRGGWGGRGRGGRCGGRGMNWGGWDQGGFDMSKLGEFISQFVPDNAAVPRPRENNTDSTTGGKDFAPEVDIFDTEDAYIVHVSLPGAKKEDVGVNWDADKSEMNVAGVIYRPGDEDFLKTLALDERKVGVFERKIRLGSKQSPAQVNSEDITAKMEDGILIVSIPKMDKDFVDVKKVDIE